MLHLAGFGGIMMVSLHPLADGFACRAIARVLSPDGPRGPPGPCLSWCRLQLFECFQPSPALHRRVPGARCRVAQPSRKPLERTARTDRSAKEGTMRGTSGWAGQSRSPPETANCRNGLILLAKTREPKGVGQAAVPLPEPDSSTRRRATRKQTLILACLILLAVSTPVRAETWGWDAQNK